MRLCPVRRMLLRMGKCKLCKAEFKHQHECFLWFIPFQHMTVKREGCRYERNLHSRIAAQQTAERFASANTSSVEQYKGSPRSLGCRCPRACLESHAPFLRSKLKHIENILRMRGSFGRLAFSICDGSYVASYTSRPYSEPHV